MSNYYNQKGEPISREEWLGLGAAELKAPGATPPASMPLCDTCRMLQASFKPEPGTDVGNGCVNCAYQNHIAMLEDRLRRAGLQTPPASPADLPTLLDAAGERESIAALLADRTEATVYLKVEGLLADYEKATSRSDFIRDHEDGRPLAERTTTPPKTGGFRC